MDFKYSELQEKIAVAYAQCKFMDFLNNCNEKEKTHGADMTVFQDFLEVGFEVARNSVE